jgi:hypothetical protein
MKAVYEKSQQSPKKGLGVEGRDFDLLENGYEAKMVS